MLKNLAKKLYLTCLGRMMSAFARALGIFKRPYMIYGYYDVKSASFRKYTRLSDTALIINRKNLSIGENVFVWHFTILDATEGLIIEEGCQIGAWVGIFTHGSQISIRLYGKEYLNFPDKIGYTRGAVKIGSYSFVGAGSIILPGVTIGKGCIIGAGSLVNKDIPDYSIVVGNPGKIAGSTKSLDKPFLDRENIQKTYYDKEILSELIKNKD